VRDRRRHLAERGEAVAQPLALLQLLDAGQVLEEERGPVEAPPRVAYLRERIPDDLPGALEPQLCAVRQVRQLEALPMMRASSGWSLSTRVNGRPTSVGRGFRPRIRYATSFITATRPSSVIASTPLRRFQTRSR
jgi:hypothetical protein